MIITYTWNITQLDCYPSVGEYQDYVMAAHWKCTGENENSVTAIMSAETFFEVEADKPGYVPYNELTESVVLGWVFEKLTPEQYNLVIDTINNAIEAQVNPPIISPELPWSN